ncbi:MAG TPA: methyltransferase domain-containing protein [archaeon]|nr:methyltransferase domain-containing protein [archaeon]
MRFTQEDTKRVFSFLAPFYDSAFPFFSHRKEEVKALRLERGDKVLDLGCGTGLSFELLEERIGPAGRIYAVDLSKEMLSLARKRARSRGWKNIDFFECDAARFRAPQKADAVLCVTSLAFMHNPLQVLENTLRQMRNGARISVSDGKLPGGFFRALGPIIASFSGLHAADWGIKPWEWMEKRLKEFHFEEKALGAMYLACGEKRG